MEFSNPIANWLSKTYEYILAHKKEVIIGAAVFVGLLAFSIGYVFYRSKLQERAHKSFVRALKYYDAKIGEKTQDVLDEAKTFATPQEKWEEVAKVFRDSFDRNKSAGIAPFFLAYQSEALLNLGKLDKSIDVLKYALHLMNKKSASYSYFRIKLALLLIDTQKQESVSQGVDILKEISLDLKNSANDLALYRLGEYFWFIKNYDEAKNYWTQLTISYGRKSAHPSLWAAQAHEKLKLITSR